jgi:hypothetical protein
MSKFNFALYFIQFFSGTTLTCYVMTQENKYMYIRYQSKGNSQVAIEAL